MKWMGGGLRIAGDDPQHAESCFLRGGDHEEDFEAGMLARWLDRRNGRTTDAVVGFDVPLAWRDGELDG